MSDEQTLCYPTGISVRVIAEGRVGSAIGDQNANEGMRERMLSLIILYCCLKIGPVHYERTAAVVVNQIRLVG